MPAKDDLKIKKLSFDGFRNYDHLVLDGLGDLTVFTGRNAAGKTNILEGIQLIATGTSFRHAAAADMLLKNSQESRDRAWLEADLASETRLLRVSLSLEKGKKRLSINGKQRQASSLSGLMPVVVFTPDDLQIPKKTSSVKRDALDYLGSQISKTYDAVLKDYRKVVRYKNKLIKDGCDEALMDSIDETLVLCGSQLHCFRIALFKRIVPLVEEGYRNIADEDGEEFAASYVPSWEHLSDSSLTDIPGYMGAEDDMTRDAVRQALYVALGEQREREASRKAAVVGPHADKITFFLGGRDAAHFASQGQQRSIVLAWKVAETRIVEQTLDQRPVLLLDDVMSELDPERRDHLVDFVKSGLQTFVTATDLSLFGSDILDKADIRALSGDGKVVPAQ